MSGKRGEPSDRDWERRSNVWLRVTEGVEEGSH